MSAPAPAAAATPAAPPAKSKKLLIIIIAAVVLILAIGGGVAAWVVSSRAPLEGEEEDVETSQKAEPAVPPTFLPLDNMVANLADPGGDRFVQIGITLELADDKTAEQVKKYLPSIRSGILLLVSQRTSAELLQIEGKEKLAADILKEVSRPLGYGASAERPRASRSRKKEEAEKPAQENPVRRVLFASFIIQ